MVQNALTKFPADELRSCRRFVTGHNADGQGVFIKDDTGDHHRLLVDGGAAANIIYSTKESPVDMNDNKDVKYAEENEVSLRFREYLS